MRPAVQELSRGQILSGPSWTMLATGTVIAAVALLRPPLDVITTAVASGGATARLPSNP